MMRAKRRNRFTGDFSALHHDGKEDEYEEETSARVKKDPEGVVPQEENDAAAASLLVYIYGGIVCG